MTDDITDAIAMFRRCYRPGIDPTSGAVSFTHIGWPRSGGADDQDPRLLDMMGAVEAAAVDVLQQQMKRARTKNRKVAKATKNRGTQ